MEARTHTCGALRETDIGEDVILQGWVSNHRNLGGFLFVDLRDRYGTVQVKFDPEIDADLFRASGELRAEWVIEVKGVVVDRGVNRNAEMATGAVELEARSMLVLNRADVPKFPVRDGIDSSEEMRLRHRHLDLRRPEVQRNLLLRSQVTFAAREALVREDFLELETPILTKSTPEGARDYLVPSRVHPGAFYALPQSPQLFKQLYMIAGFDRYYQITRCFRDEDLRLDRQPEFTQIDIEASFVDEAAIQGVAERMLARVFRQVLGVELELPFARLSYADAMERYGSDKPDLRFGLELCNVSDLVERSSFGVFRGAVEAGGSVRGLRVPEGAKMSRKQIDELEKVARAQGAKGLAWCKLGADGWSGPIARFFEEDARGAFESRMEAAEGDLLLFVADGDPVVSAALGALRNHLGRALSLIDTSRWAFAWVVNFPLLEWDEESGRHMAMHHPFTAPVPEDVELLATDPGRVRARAYDVVLNGFEIGGGSIRIHDADVQAQMLEHLGIGEAEAEAKFGFLLRALRSGAPPHGGLAFGLDRIAMIMANARSLRDVIAFPKTTRAYCLLTDAPGEAAASQLRELHLSVEAGATESGEADGEA